MLLIEPSVTNVWSMLGALNTYPFIDTSTNIYPAVLLLLSFIAIPEFAEL